MLFAYDRWRTEINFKKLPQIVDDSKLNNRDKKLHSENDETDGNRGKDDAESDSYHGIDSYFRKYLTNRKNADFSEYKHSSLLNKKTHKNDLKALFDEIARNEMIGNGNDHRLKSLAKSIQAITPIRSENFLKLGLDKTNTTLSSDNFNQLHAKALTDTLYSKPKNIYRGLFTKKSSKVYYDWNVLKEMHAKYKDENDKLEKFKRPLPKDKKLSVEQVEPKFSLHEEHELEARDTLIDLSKRQVRLTRNTNGDSTSSITSLRKQSKIKAIKHQTSFANDLAQNVYFQLNANNLQNDSTTSFDAFKKKEEIKFQLGAKEPDDIENNELDKSESFSDDTSSFKDMSKILDLKTNEAGNTMDDLREYDDAKRDLDLNINKYLKETTANERTREWIKMHEYFFDDERRSLLDS